MAGAAAVAVVAATITVAVATGRAHSGEHRPAALSRAPTTTAAAGDLTAFLTVQRRPAAAGPIRTLPNVDPSLLTVGSIPHAARAAYDVAARRAAPAGCGLHWWLLAGIGFVESDHGAPGGSTAPGWTGLARPPIYGPRLDGSHGYPRVLDTDRGAFDRDGRFDRAVGPMQFLPGSWRRWAGAGPVAGRTDPQQIGAAASAAARFLCAAGGRLSSPSAAAVAVYAYDHSFDYTRLVLTVAARYAGLPPAALGVDRLPTDAEFGTPPPTATHHRPRRQATHAPAGPHRVRAPASAVATTTAPRPAPGSSSASSSQSPSPS